MLVLESKLKGKAEQFRAIDEAIQTAQFVRNKALRHWMDNREIGKFDLNKLCAVLARDFEWCKKLNSMARQASAERAWSAIARFYENCKNPAIKKKAELSGGIIPPEKFLGYPRFRKNVRSVEYKTSGWALSGKKLTLTDGFGAGTFKLVGTRDLIFYSKAQFKHVRVVRRADGYYAQFCIALDRELAFETTGKAVGLDVGLNHFYTDSDGVTLYNPRYLRKSEKLLKRRQRKVSKKFKKGVKRQSSNYRKARNRLALKHLKVSRQRKDFAVKAARCVIQSNDLVVLEDLRVSNMVRNRKLAKSISDASWSLFRQWLEYFGQAPNKQVIAVPPHWTSQKCSGCGEVVAKSLSTRTHQCPSCLIVLDRDQNAAINILNTQGHWGINAWGDGTTTVLSASLMQQVASVNQESASLQKLFLKKCSENWK